MEDPHQKEAPRLPLLLVLTVSTILAPLLRAANLESLEHLRPAPPIIPDHAFTLTDFGAVGDGRSMNTEAFTRAVAAVQSAGGDRLVVPKGVFRTGPFTLCSQLDLHLEAGAVIQAPDTFEAMGIPDPSKFKSQAEADPAYRVPAPLISGSNLHDVAITGSGTIDGSGRHWWEYSERAAREAAKKQPGRIVYRRPHLIVINGCERLRVADVTLINSPMFHLVPKNVTDLTVEGLKVRSPFDAPNTDAIDPGSCRNVWIHHCDIDTGDDDIVIKQGGSNILIEDNAIHHGHGISIGSETVGGIHDMLVRNCTFDRTDNGLRIKSMLGAGGLVENIRYTDISMKNVQNAFVLQLDYRDNNRPSFKGDPSKIPTIRNIRFDHITIENSRRAGMIHGLPESIITGLTFSDVTLTAERDFDIRDAEQPSFQHITRTIKSGLPAPPPGH